jgi:creatinine deaminase
MAQRMYQIFVSSTYRDLIPHRQKLLSTLLTADFFPVGMELWAAESAAVWTTIERKLRNADYYVLLIGGKYGSTNGEGTSYTELEYELAYNLTIPILAFVHGNPESLPLSHSETDPAKSDRLKRFIDIVEKRHHVARWTNEDDLALKVVTALTNAARDQPRPGYARTDSPGGGAVNQRTFLGLPDLPDLGFTRGTGKPEHGTAPDASEGDYQHGLRSAVQQALKSASEGGIPSGAALLDAEGTVLALAHNERVQRGASIAHPEVLCVERAGRRRDWDKLTLVSTLSPCIMCAGAIVLHRIRRVVIGENRTFMGREDLLRNDGIKVVVADDPKCVALMSSFIRGSPDLWSEDIGIPPNP